MQYVTSDQSGGNECGQVTGQASQRCDYTMVSGTLNFGPGETSKTISIPIINDEYVDGTEVFTIHLRNPVVATLGPISQATVSIGDDDLVSGANPIDDINFFVRQHYLDFLGREPDAEGFAYWTGILNGCGPDLHCINRVRIEISSRFFIELEFQRTGFFVMRLYRASFGQPPTYAQFMEDRQLVQDTTESQKQFASAWVARPAFISEYPTNLSHADFVNRLYDRAGVQNPSARAAAISALTNAQKTRADVIFDLAELAEFKDREYNPAFVRMQYFGYLRRDIDQSGYNFWINVVNSTNNYRSMICGFLNSHEYQLRFGPTRATFSELDCSW